MKNSLILWARLSILQSFLFPAHLLCMTIENDTSIAKKIITHTDPSKYRSYTVASQECPKTAVALYQSAPLPYPLLSVIMQYLDCVKTLNIPLRGEHYGKQSLAMTYWSLAGGPTFGQIRNSLNLQANNNGEQTVIEYTSRDNEDERVTDFTKCSPAQQILNADKNYEISSIKITAIHHGMAFFHPSKLF